MRTLVTTIVCAVITNLAAIADERAAKIPDISIKDLKKAIAAKKVVLLDANGSKSFEKGHLPAAIDYAANEKTLAKALPKDKDILVVAYCSGPACNAYEKAALAAKKLGFSNVKHLSAGLFGWMQAGEKIEKGKTKKVEVKKA